MVFQRFVPVAMALTVSMASACSASPTDAGTRSLPGAVAKPSCAHRALSKLTLHERVGQLFVSGVDSSAPTHDQLRAIGRYHLGGVILTGRSNAGVDAVRRLSHRLQRRSKGPAKLWIAADQEGGYVQALRGPGFSDIPTALQQGRLSPHHLRARAHKWGSQLRRAGVNLDLAPVADTVPASLGTGNPPIGRYYREYAHRPGRVAKHARAAWRGLRSAHVSATAKHFPGLGRVRANTDTTAHVRDAVTTRHDRYVRPFRALVDAGIPLVMVSSARYTRIDRSHLAAFSPTVMRGMLRWDLDFKGVVISDDFGSAAAVQNLPAGKRAVRFLRAGGTVVLTVSAAVVPAMVRAVWRRAKNHEHLRSLVRADVLRVLRAKRGNGLVSCHH